MEIEEGAEGFITIVPPVGYTVDDLISIIEGAEYVEIIEDDSRGLVIRFIAKFRGRTLFRVNLFTIGEGSGGFTIDIAIDINFSMGKT